MRRLLPPWRRGPSSRGHEPCNPTSQSSASISGCGWSDVESLEEVGSIGGSSQGSGDSKVWSEHRGGGAGEPDAHATENHKGPQRTCQGAHRSRCICGDRESSSCVPNAHRPEARWGTEGSSRLRRAQQASPEGEVADAWNRDAMQAAKCGTYATPVDLQKGHHRMLLSPDPLHLVGADAGGAPTAAGIPHSASLYPPLCSKPAQPLREG